MNPNTAAEIVRMSHEAPLAVGPLSPTQQTAKDLRDHYRPEDPLAGLKPKEKPKTTDLDTQAELDRRFGKAPAAGSEAGRLKKRSETASKEARTIAEQGLTGIAGARRQEAIVDSLVTNVLDTRDQYQGLTQDQKRDIVRNLISDEQGRLLLAETLAVELDPEAEMPETAESLKTKVAERAEAQREKKKLKKTVTKLEAEFNEAQTAVTEHQPGGVRALRISTLESLSPQVKINNIEARLGANDPLRKPAFDALKTSVTAKLRTVPPTPLVNPDEQAMKEYLDATENISELEKLKAERDSAPEALKRAKKDLKEAKEARKNNKRKREDLNEEITDLEEQRSEELKDTAKRLGSVLSTAINKHLDRDDEARLTYLNQKTETDAKESGDQAEVIFDTKVKERWQTTKMHHGHPRPEYIKAKISTDWEQDLVGDNASIDAKIKTMFTVGSDAAKKFNDDPAFRDKLRQRYLTGLIAARRETAKIHAGEIKLLSNNGWESSIEAAITADDKLKKQIDSLTGKTNDVNYLDKLKRQFGNNWLAILGLLFIGAIGPARSVVESNLDNRELGR
jgi:hypothetical protein